MKLANKPIGARPAWMMNDGREQDGMTLLEYGTFEAMKALIIALNASYDAGSTGGSYTEPESIAKEAIKHAKATIAELEKQSK